VAVSSLKHIFYHNWNTLLVLRHWKNFKPGIQLEHAS